MVVLDNCVLVFPRCLLCLHIHSPLPSPGFRFNVSIVVSYWKVAEERKKKRKYSQMHTFHEHLILKDY